MYAQLLERRHGESLGDDRRIIDGICQATGQSRELIRDLLEYSKAGRGELRARPVDSNHLVNEVLEMLAAPIQEAGAVVDVEELPGVTGDPATLPRVFQNLTSNATKFWEGAPHVPASAERDDGVARFSGADNGIGMAPKDAKEIFEPFHRLHGGSHYPGTG